jgi:hypothetical protein
LLLKTTEFCSQLETLLIQLLTVIDSDSSSLPWRKSIGNVITCLQDEKNEIGVRAAEALNTAWYLFFSRGGFGEYYVSRTGWEEQVKANQAVEELNRKICDLLTQARIVVL